jgi:hypothetical protein
MQFLLTKLIQIIGMGRQGWKCQSEVTENCRYCCENPFATVFKFSFFDREVSGSPSNLSQSHPQKRIRSTEAIKRQINSFKSTNSPNSIIKTFLFCFGMKKE